MFHVITKSLQLSKVQDLVAYVIKQHLFPDPGEPSPDDQEMMCLFDITSCRAVPSQGYCYSPPNSVAALTHWKILVLLLQQLSPSCKQHLFNMQFSVIKSASGFAVPSSGISSIFEISTAPVPGTRIATLGMPGPSQDHTAPPSVVCVSQGPSQDHPPSQVVSRSQGPLQDHLGQPTGLASRSQGPPQDCLGQSTVSAKCPPQDSPQPQASTSGPSQDPWSILGSSESTIAPVLKVPAVSPAASSVMMPFVEPLLPDGQWFSY